MVAMKRLSLALIPLFATLAGGAVAGPSSQVAWDLETMQLLASGDAARGQQLAGQCASCHGGEGVSPSPNWPSLAGQLNTYLYKQMRDYKDGTRKDPIMSALVQDMAEQDMADLAAFYAARSLPGTDERPSGDDAATKLVKMGDGPRLIPSCMSCHGRSGHGNRVLERDMATMPALVGQYPAYLEKTLQDYKSGKRGNDVYRRMRAISEQLTETEIKSLSDYYGTLAP